VLTCLLFGLIPAAGDPGYKSIPLLKEGRLGDRARWRRRLVVVQVALSLVPGDRRRAFTRSLAIFTRSSQEFDRRGVPMFEVDLRKAG
jgi:hypothetical protein